MVNLLFAGEWEQARRLLSVARGRKCHGRPAIEAIVCVKATDI